MTKTVTGNVVDRAPARLRDQRGFTLVELLIALTMVGLLMAGVASAYMTGSAIYLTGANQAQSQQDTRVALMMLEEDIRLAGSGCPPNGCRTGPNTFLKITAAAPGNIGFFADLGSRSTVLAADVNAGATTLTVPTPTLIQAGDAIYLVNGAQWEIRPVNAVTAGNPNTTITVGAATFQDQNCPCLFPRGAQVGLPRAIAYAWNAGTITRDIGDGNGPQTLVTGVPTFVLTYLDASGNAPATPADIRQVMINMTVQSASTLDGGTTTIVSDIRPRNL